MAPTVGATGIGLTVTAKEVAVPLPTGFCPYTEIDPETAEALTVTAIVSEVLVPVIPAGRLQS